MAGSNWDAFDDKSDAFGMIVAGEAVDCSCWCGKKGVGYRRRLFIIRFGLERKIMMVLGHFEREVMVVSVLKRTILTILTHLNLTVLMVLVLEHNTP